MPDQDTHPWSSSPASQAAVRRAEGDPGPAIQHRDLPHAVERLAERVRALEVAHNGLVEVAKIDARWMRCAAREECEVKEKDIMISDGIRTEEQPAAVTNPMPEATTGSGSGTGLRTERVTLEFKCRGDAISRIGFRLDGILAANGFFREGESVRVVPTPGPGLTEEEWAAIDAAAQAIGDRIDEYKGQEGDTRRIEVIDALLARDAAARESGNSGVKLGSESGSEIARLTAERDAAVAHAADAERALEAESTARAQAVAELEAARAAPTEATQEPVAWAAVSKSGQPLWLAYSRSDAEGAVVGMADVVPLYRATQPLLTAEEREAVRVSAALNPRQNDGRTAATLRALLARTGGV